jgi:hypothetical protein
VTNVDSEKSCTAHRFSQIGFPRQNSTLLIHISLNFKLECIIQDFVVFDCVCNAECKNQFAQCDVYSDV